MSLRAHDEAELAEILVRHPGALEPVGGGSKRSIGRPVDAALLDLSSLTGIIDYEPRELMLVARAATPLAEVARVLAGEHQRLAFEPPELGSLLGTAARASIGGVIAANLSGSRRLTAGAARDHFLGFRAVSGRGERFKGGGRVVKNVTGYDLPKLLAGSWGTLAVLTEVIVRVHPAPEFERTLVLGAAEPSSACGLMARALAAPCEVSGAAFVPGRGVLLRLEGFARSVAARTATLLGALDPPDCATHEDAESRRIWGELGAAAPVADAPIVWRLSIPPQDAAAVLRELVPERYFLDWGGGLLWLAAASAEPQRVRAAVRRGHALLIKAPAEVRATVPVFQPRPPPLARLEAALKSAFDPDVKLNPGRMS